MSGRVLLKFIMFAFNIINMLISITIITYGVIIRLQWDTLKIAHTSTSGFSSIAPYIAIALGVFIFIIAFCGCYGFISEIKCLIFTFAVFMAVFATIMICAVVMLFVYDKKMPEIIEIVLEYVFKNTEMNSLFHLFEGLRGCTALIVGYLNEAMWIIRIVLICIIVYEVLMSLSAIYIGNKK